MKVAVSPASRIGGAARLEALFVRVFGGGARPDGWFPRKLRREAIDDAGTLVAHDGDVAPDDPAGWCGLVLGGCPPSLGGTLRTAGTGVLAEHRGTGIGRALVQALRASGGRRGATGLRIHAARDQASFYERCGLVQTGTHVTIHARACGAGPIPWGSPTGWDDYPGPDAASTGGWLAEAWDRTEPHLRTTVADSSGTVAHLGLEGDAVVVHRLRHPHTLGTTEALDRVLELVPAPLRVYVPALPQDPTANQTKERWTVVQRSVQMECPCGG